MKFLNRQKVVPWMSMYTIVVFGCLNLVSLGNGVADLTYRKEGGIIDCVSVGAVPEGLT